MPNNSVFDLFQYYIRQFFATLFRNEVNNNPAQSFQSKNIPDRYPIPENLDSRVQAEIPQKVVERAVPIQAELEEELVQIPVENIVQSQNTPDTGNILVESKGSDVDADIMLNTHRDSIVVENEVDILENSVNDELYQVEREPEPVENLEFETVVENEMTNVVEESVEKVEIETVSVYVFSLVLSQQLYSIFRMDISSC